MMKLYYAKGACSLFPHIVAEEAGIPLTLENVDIFKMPHMTDAGVDYALVNTNLYVPALQLEDGTILTEGVAIAQYLADLKPESGLAPKAGTIARVKLQSWLNFVSTELHKMYSPWLFHPEYGEQAQGVARGKIAERLAYVDKHLAANGPFLMGEDFTAADAYLFTIVSWSRYTKVDLTPFSHVSAFLDKVRERPAVRAAIHAENRKVAA